MNPDRVAMVDEVYCIGCDYELSGLGAGRCPECGRAFDPDDASSVLSGPQFVKRALVVKWLGVGVVGFGSVPMLANVFGYAALVAARVSLGRWPRRYGADDPSHLFGVGMVGGAALLLVIASVPALIAGLLLVNGLVLNRAPRRALWCGIFGLVLWTVGFVLTRWDPAEVFVWLWD